MSPAGDIGRPIHRYVGGEFTAADDRIVVETPLEIQLGTTPLAVLMRTPGNDEDLVRGFAITEAIVLRPSEIEAVVRVGAEDDARWRIVLAEGVAVDPEQFRRNLYATSSCGVCGKASIDAIRLTTEPLGSGPEIDPDTLYPLVERMRRAQTTFETTGGLHAAAAFSTDGDLLALREDIGRHNAVDKLVGALSHQMWPLAEVVLTVSGRVSFEIVQKAAVAGIPMVCGVSAASSLAIELAEELGMTVVGFLREDSFNVYTRIDRLMGQGGSVPEEPDE